MSDKPIKVADLNGGAAMGRLRANDGKMARGAAFQPVKPANVAPPQELPIPPQPTNSNGGSKKQ